MPERFSAPILFSLLNDVLSATAFFFFDVVYFLGYGYTLSYEARASMHYYILGNLLRM